LPAPSRAGQWPAARLYRGFHRDRRIPQGGLRRGQASRRHTRRIPAPRALLEFIADSTGQAAGTTSAADRIGRDLRIFLLLPTQKVIQKAK
jgi:hypothetical protein